MLHMPLECRRELEAWARASYPEEGCGARVLRVCRARNANAERARDRYELDPLDYLAAGRLAGGRRLLDSSSGNAGISYAMLGAARGYRSCYPG
ncbi:MAG: hypothetical protein AB1768_03915 [Pseudomonadota bacterium]|jgi:cysteine synthase